MREVMTMATFVSQTVPSSSNNTLRVTLMESVPEQEGGFSFQTCQITGVPEDEAANVGNCEWTRFVDNGFDLLFFRFNFQEVGQVGTAAVWGQFCLLNDAGVGNWVRFFTSDGTSAAVVGSASGPLTYSPAGLPMP